MASSTAFAEEIVRNAISHSHKGGNWHYAPIGSAGDAILDPGTEYLFHSGDRTNVIVLNQPLGSVEQALESYRDQLWMAYLGIDTNKTNTLRVITEALSSRAFLAELCSCFEGIEAIRISDALANTLTSSDYGRARELTADIKANAALMMMSELKRLRPDRVDTIVQDVLLPIVNGVYEHLQDAYNLYRSRTTVPPLFAVPPGHRLSAHIPAESQPDIPDGISFTSIPSHLAANPWDNPVVSIPVGTSLGPIPKTSSKRKHDSGPRMNKSSETFVPKSKKRRSGKSKGQSRANQENAIPASVPSGPSTSNATGSLTIASPEPSEPPSGAGPSRRRKPRKSKKTSSETKSAFPLSSALPLRLASSSSLPSPSPPMGLSLHHTLTTSTLASVGRATTTASNQTTAAAEPQTEQLQTRNLGKVKRKYMTTERDIASNPHILSSSA